MLSARRTRPIVLVTLATTLAVALLGLPGIAAADDGVSAGDTVVGTFVQTWPEYEDRAEAVARGEEGPLSWVQTDDGDAVRVATDDVEHLDAGATVEVQLGDEVPDPATDQGIEPAREVVTSEVVEPAPSAAAPPPTSPASPPFTNSVTVVMVVPAGGVRDSATLADVVAQVNGPVADFWESQTSGSIKVGVTDQHDWITASVGCSDPYELWDEVAGRVGFVPGPQKHLLLYVSSASAGAAGCAYGLAEVGSTWSDGGFLYVRDVKTSVLAHELGHNLGLGHSSARHCTRSPYEGTCSTEEYADYYDVMGYSWDQVGSLNVVQAQRLTTVTTAPFAVGYPDRTVTLAPVSGRTGYRAVRIDAGGSYYSLEYRTADGQDSWLGTTDNVLALQTGVLLRLASDDDSTSLLLDGTPSPQAGWEDDTDVALPVGTPVAIPSGQYAPGRITVTVQSLSAAGAVVQLTAQAADPADDARCAGSARRSAPISGVAFLTNTHGTAALAVASDRAVWSRAIDGAARWRSLGGSVRYGPAATVAGASSYIFAVGTDRALWYRMDSGRGWSPWRSLGGSLNSSPAAASLGTGHVRVFGRGGDGAMWSRELWRGGWSPWVRHGGALSSSPSATVDAVHDQIEVDARGTDGYVYRQYLTAGERPSGWTWGVMTLCSTLLTAPVQTMTDPADGVYLDPGGVPRLLDGWSSRSLGGRLTANPAVRFEGADVLVAGRGADGALWLYDGRGGRNRWVSLGGRI